jgi:hypothetical protein
LNAFAIFLSNVKKFPFVNSAMERLGCEAAARGHTQMTGYETSVILLKLI